MFLNVPDSVMVFVEIVLSIYIWSYGEGDTNQSKSQANCQVRIDPLWAFQSCEELNWWRHMT